MLIGSFTLQADDHADIYNFTSYPTIRVHTRSKHKNKSKKTKHDEDNFHIVQSKRGAFKPHAFSCNGDLQTIDVSYHVMDKDDARFSFDGKSLMDSIRKCPHGGGLFIHSNKNGKLTTSIACNG